MLTRLPTRERPATGRPDPFAFAAAEAALREAGIGFTVVEDSASTREPPAAAAPAGRRIAA